MDYASSDGTAGSADYAPSGGTLTFAASQASVTFNVSIADDALGEGNETVGLTLSNPGGGATLSARTSATLNILDNDAFLRFAAASYSIGEGGRAAVVVQRVNSPAAGVTVTYAAGAGGTADGTDYTLSPGTLTFAANQASKALTVATANDTLDEDNETVVVELTGASIALVAPTQATLTIVDND